MAEDAPALRVWVYPIVAASAMMLLFFSYCYSSYGPYGKVVALSNKNLEKALIETTGDTSILSIVVIGSSLTENAFEDAHAVEDSIFHHIHAKTKMLRVAFNYMDMDLMKRVDLFNYITKYPPDYLFLENFTFNIDHVDSTLSITPPIDAALLQIRNYVRNALGATKHDNYYIKWYTFDVKPPEEFYTHKFDSLGFKGLQKKKCLARKVSKNRIANNAYDTLFKRNTKVAFLDMPQSDKLQTNFLDHESTSELNDVLKFYNTRYHIDYWRFPYLMDDDCFTDGIHLNSKGAMEYQKWFVSEFK